MLLENKVPVIYGAGGPIGGAVARAFAREGARVFLAGRTLAKLDTVANEIRSTGGSASTIVVDATDEQAVDSCVDAVVEQAGSLDISFNLISYGDVQQPLTMLSAEDFLQPITTAMRTHFLTTRAAARHMISRQHLLRRAHGLLSHKRDDPQQGRGAREPNMIQLPCATISIGMYLDSGMTVGDKIEDDVVFKERLEP